MKIINWSSKKFGQLQIFVDDEDYDNLKKYPWGVLKCINSDVLYVKARNVDPLRPRKYYSMHRFILGIDDPTIFVDHIDGNGLNNQKSNLRLCTHRQNKMNMGKQKNNSTGFKGVYRLKDGRYKTSLSIRKDGKRIHLRSFESKDIIECALKYNELSRQYHGEFAYQNQINI